MQAPVPVLRRWPGACILVVGSGPSLQADDLTPFAHLPVIAINDALWMVPWADVHYASDRKWWDWHAARALAYPADHYTLDPQAKHCHPELGLLNYRLGSELSDDPKTVTTYGHSGGAAINLAYHLTGPGGSIVLLGYDLAADESGRHHFFGAHPDNSHVRYDQWRSLYSTLVEQLTTRNVSIHNASRRTSITAIPRLFPARV